MIKSNLILHVIVVSCLSIIVLFGLCLISCTSEESNPKISSKSMSASETFAKYLDKMETEDPDLIQKLDAYELHFDADSYFIVINPMYSDVGIYYGPYPMKHFKQSFDWSGDRWVGQYQDLKKRGIILNEEIYTYLHVAGFPETTPVLMMNFSVE